MVSRRKALKGLAGLFLVPGTAKAILDVDGDFKNTGYGRYRVKVGETTGDIATRFYGESLYAEEFLCKNNGITIGDDPGPGTLLRIDYNLALANFQSQFDMLPKSIRGETTTTGHKIGG